MYKHLLIKFSQLRETGFTDSIKLDYRAAQSRVTKLIKVIFEPQRDIQSLEIKFFPDYV